MKKAEKHNKRRLQPGKLGIALGIVVSFFMVVLGLGAGLLGWGTPIVRIISSLYLGYDSSIKGLVVGMIWGFLDGFIGGYLFALVYNKLEKCSI